MLPLCGILSGSSLFVTVLTIQRANSLSPGIFSCLVVVCFFFKKKESNFFEKIFQEYHMSVKQMYPDQVPCFVGPDLGPICLQRLSANGTRR